jgi:hypothetical protein
LPTNVSFHSPFGQGAKHLVLPLIISDLTYHVILADKYRQANNGLLHLKPLSIYNYAGNPAPQSWHKDCFCFLPRDKPESNETSYCLTALTAF